MIGPRSMEVSRTSAPFPGNRRVNDQIRLSPVKVIDDTGTMLGEIPTAEALRRAREAGLDLVEVDPNSRPPVCKIMDYGKFKYHESKKKHHKAPEQKLKEVRLRPKTDTHDRQIKVAHAKEFLDKGNKVQFTMMFRGRERSHPELAVGIFNDILKDLGATAKLERPAKLEGKRMTMVVMPAGHLTAGPKPAAPARPPAPAAPKPAASPPSQPPPSAPPSSAAPQSPAESGAVAATSVAQKPAT